MNPNRLEQFVRQLGAGLVVLTLLFGCASRRAPSTMSADTLYLEGDLYTSDPRLPRAEAFAVRDGEIVFVGSNDAARASVDATTQVDLGGRFVMPGVVDAHAHPGLVALIGELEQTGSVLAQDSKKEFWRSLRELAQQTREEPFVVAGDWDVAMFLPEGPHKKDLDDLFPDKPVILFDNSGHSTWFNSAAFAAFGVGAHTPDLSAGVSILARDGQGEPTGWVKEFVLMREMDEMLLRPPEEIGRRLSFFLEYLSAHGVTTLWDAGNFTLDDAIYKALSQLDREGRLPLRYEGSFHIFDPQQIESAVSELLALRAEYASANLTFRSIKIHYDGVVEIGTAGMLEPYEIGPPDQGGFLFTHSRLADFLAELEQHDIDLHLHAVGDAATREILDAVELARSRKNGPLEIEVTISHLEHVAAADMPRLAELEVHANFTPHWWGGTFFGAAGEIAVGKARIESSQPAKALFASGANVTLSSDVTTLSAHHRANPFLGLQMSMTKQEFDGGPDAPVFGSVTTRLSLEEALAGYTINGARQLGREDELGSLTVGKRADFVVLDKSPFATDVYELKDLKPVAVVLDGEVVSGTLENE